MVPWRCIRSSTGMHPHRAILIALFESYHPQYMGSASLVRVDWGKAAGKFENLFYTKDAAGGTRPPNVLSLWHWLINFLTADFQPRASFIAGFVLGLRIG